MNLQRARKKIKMRQEKKSGKSFFKTAADAEKYLNEKNEDTVPDNGLEEKDFDESGEVSNDVSDNGLSGDIYTVPSILVSSFLSALTCLAALKSIRFTCPFFFNNYIRWFNVSVDNCRL